MPTNIDLGGVGGRPRIVVRFCKRSPSSECLKSLSWKSSCVRRVGAVKATIACCKKWLHCECLKSLSWKSSCVRRVGAVKATIAYCKQRLPFLRRISKECVRLSSHHHRYLWLLVSEDIVFRSGRLLASMAFTSQLLHSYFTVTSQLLHSYFMVKQFKLDNCSLEKKRTITYLVFFLFQRIVPLCWLFYEVIVK